MTFLEGMIVLWSLIFAVYLMVDRICRCVEKSSICKSYNEFLINGGDVEDLEAKQNGQKR